MTSIPSKDRLLVTALATTLPRSASPALAASPEPAVLVDVLDGGGRSVSDLKTANFAVHAALATTAVEPRARSVAIRSSTELLPGVYALYLDHGTHGRDESALIVDVYASDATGRALVGLQHR